MNDQIPDLKIERMDDEQGTLILLEQDNTGNIERVAIHPIHLRYMAETFGLVPTRDPEGARAIATLQRRLRILQERSEHLATRIAAHAGSINLDYEVAYAGATSAMATEFCLEAESSR